MMMMMITAHCSLMARYLFPLKEGRVARCAVICLCLGYRFALFSPFHRAHIPARCVLLLFCLVPARPTPATPYRRFRFLFAAGCAGLPRFSAPHLPPHLPARRDVPPDALLITKRRASGPGRCGMRYGLRHYLRDFAASTHTRHWRHISP